MQIVNNMNCENALPIKPEVSEVTLIYKTNVNPKDRAVITSSHDAYQLLFSSWNKNCIEYVEEFKILLLNRSNRVLGIASLSKGTTSGSLVDIKLILQYAIKTNAYGIIIAHNHPSGNSNPSISDTAITRKVKEAISYMDISLLDHLIILPIDGYYSFADEGIL
jgi:DNA repair protein RadC